MDLFKTRDHVSNFDDYVAEYKVLSEKTRSTLKSDIGVPYGAGRNEVMDIFYPPTPVQASPIHLFIHGGYWRMFSKDDFSFVANTITACGAIAAVMDYDLMPDVRMEKIVDQVRQAFAWLHGNATKLGGDAKQLSISGHSAGAHLATFTFSAGLTTPPPKSALLLSGIYDLKPLQRSFLDPLIAITDEEADKFSPVRLPHAREPEVFLAYGDEETLPFSAQAQNFNAVLAQQGAKSSVTALASSNHMSAVRDLERAGSRIGQLLRTAIGHS